MTSPETRPRGAQSAGKLGEDVAASSLERAGYKILCRNYRCRHGELDIVAREGRHLVFVEVKSRRSSRCGEPHEAVDSRKQRRMSRAALHYLQHHGGTEQDARFDVLLVRFTGGGPEIRLIRNAFEVCP